MHANFFFGQWLENQRKQRRLTRQSLAKNALLAGHQISQQYVHCIETGKATNIGSDKILALASGLGIPVAVVESVLFQQSSLKIPLKGRTAAGNTIGQNTSDYDRTLLPYEYIAPDQAFELGQGTLADPRLYYVEVIGDSMAPKMEHGDWALIQPLDHRPFISGRIYLIEEKPGKRTTCKYLVEDLETLGQYWLMAENESLFAKTPYHPKQHRIAGEVIELRKTQTLSRPVL